MVSQQSDNGEYDENDEDDENDDDDGGEDGDEFTPSVEEDGGDPTTSCWTAERLHRASFKDLGSPQVVEEKFLRHLLSSSSCRESLLILLSSESTTTRDYSLEIDAFDMCQANPPLGSLLLRFPSTLLPLLENAIVRAQNHLKEELLREQQTPSDREVNEGAMMMESQSLRQDVRTWFVKGDQALSSSSSSSSGRVTNTTETTTTTTPLTRVHARLVHLPPYCCKTSLAASMEASDVGKILQVSGTVVRASQVQMYESARTYKCTGKNGCGRTFVEVADLEQRHNALVTPELCPRLNESGERCRGTNLQPVPNGSIHTDYQEIKIQEGASQLGVGHMPRSLLCKLEHDLVDRCQPGDEVVLVGSLLAQWQSLVCVDVECDVGMALQAHSIRVLQERGASSWNNPPSTNNANNNRGSSNVGELEKMRKEFDAYWEDSEHKAKPIAARDFICQAVCPKLYGMAIVKLALLVTLIGGVSCDSYAMKDTAFESNESDTDVVSVDGENCATNSDNLNRASRKWRDPRNSLYDDALSDDGADKPIPFRLAADARKEQRPDVSFQYRCHDQESYQKSSRNNKRKILDRHADGIRKNRSAQVNSGRTVRTRRRPNSHLLLVGDPGCGKSQFLRFAAALSPRSVLTTGVGTTSAGLTCAAVREGSSKEFVLEAGALVLADQGVCCIDEFGCIQAADRTTIHEAMEQQTLSVAKAGIVCKLNCRATIIAVMNPRDNLYDNHASLSRNTGLGTPLLSRFDIIFKLVDSSDAQRDSNITTYLLNRAIMGGGFEASEDPEYPAGKSASAPWNMDKLRAYIAVVKDRFNPVMSDDAATLLELHYEKIRMAENSTIPVTVRFLESLIRLSQAHARLMYRTYVALEDAVATIRIMECSAMAYGGFDGNVDDVENILYCDPMTMDFSPSSADRNFLCFEYKLLEKYNLLYRLSDERRREAMSYMESEGLLLRACTTSAWGEIENPRDRGLQQQYPQDDEVRQDHYGRVHFASQRDRSWASQQHARDRDPSVSLETVAPASPKRPRNR